MTDTEDEDSPQTKPRRTHFRRSDGPKLTPDAASRQGAVTKLAFEMLGKDGAIAYLNLDSESLGGRPLDLATASVDGLKRVESDLAARRAGVGA
ncbi:hypothetical protein V474_23840 [Novosphingobium barchaimii LL02]|uniref:Antitoxin Xre/MbcA/ParS-like toxin-binding domain-containing protein n=1 Tax=Novosphingobium barchaimii LL02 TaxID=1114963 RepID=A0A0J7XKS1_9SPHN|nr:hypothetical protein [Novosphingobium barchaimii]KMS52591.1 hypothetical protein V474_23840 [Novosphingobium barchaimii LL02]